MNGFSSFMSSASLLMDVIPVLVIAALIISFLIKQSRYKREEKELKETIEAFRNRNRRKGEQR
ncbi:MAG: hypothetical protein E7190_04965 [Erysipelotrichaceae bacterium]|nr:hypothetical protein [Erysipelotrichaceae bacterium]